MQGKWRIADNHITLQYGDEILHPGALEVYSVLSSEKGNFVEDIECQPIQQAFPNIHFSKFGTNVRCVLDNQDDGEIKLTLQCNRKGKIVPVDLIEGEIVDQCITDSEWFYVTGSTAELSTIFQKTGIKKMGKISISQYLELIKNDKNYELGTVVNHVKTSRLDKKIDIGGSLPIGLNAKLYKYQKVGFFWMRYMLSENHGCILGDEMGLGKTLQVITLMLDYKSKGNIPMLVVAPVSLLQNWKRECEKFAPKLKVYIHHGPNRTGRYKYLEEYDLVVTSYSMVVSDASLFSMLDWKLVVLDEAQNIKNPVSERTKFVKKIPRKSCIAVTGTPFENHMTDIWSLVDFVMPGLLGSQKEYTDYISDDIRGADKLEPLLSPIMIRRMVSNVAADLPDKIVIPQPIEMSDKEALKYEEYRCNESGEYDDGKLNLGMLQKLRMYCTHPLLCDEDCSQDPCKESVKYQRFCEIIEEIVLTGEKIILFTSYQKMFNIFEKDVPDRFSIPVWKINGSTPVENRQTIVDEFNEYKGSALLVLNPRAAGTGLNITSANHVIHYNLEWNPALEDQASARAYRKGQEKTVFIYRFYYQNTVEQIVNERIERKREMAVAAVVGTDGTFENREDVIAALNISPIKEKKDD